MTWLCGTSFPFALVVSGVGYAFSLCTCPIRRIVRTSLRHTGVVWRSSFRPSICLGNASILRFSSIYACTVSLTVLCFRPLRLFPPCLYLMSLSFLQCGLRRHYDTVRSAELESLLMLSRGLYDFYVPRQYPCDPLKSRS